MLGENHALIFEFPEHRERIHQLKVADSDFNSLAKRYHQLDHKIRGLEATQVPAEDQYFMQMKLQRPLRNEIGFCSIVHFCFSTPRSKTS